MRLMCRWLTFPVLAGHLLADSPCDTGCGPGTQSQTASCSWVEDGTGAGSACGAGCAPSSQGCSNGNCFSWHTSPWSGCAPSCGASGSQSRSVDCYDDTAGGFGGGCVGPAPDSTQGCAIPHCYAWSTSGFGPCGPSCGASGTQYQTIDCVDTTTNTGGQAAGNCGAAPATSQSCPIPHCYSWHLTSTGACTGCGGPSSGTQSLSWTCYDDTTGTPSAGNCGASPATSQTCTPASHCYAWVEDGFGGCSATCGGTNSGVQTQVSRGVHASYLTSA
jgi:hypothetical protein